MNIFGKEIIRVDDIAYPIYSYICLNAYLIFFRAIGYMRIIQVVASIGRYLKCGDAEVRAREASNDENI